MNIPAWGWFLTIGLMAVFLLIDIFVIARRPHVPSMAEAGRHLAFYVAAAVLFGLFVWFEWGGQYAGEFYAGWLTEYSLSVDNLFVFLLIMASFKVPQKLQQSALMVGIVIAIILRGIFIALGAVVINAYSWVFYIFGAFLVYTAVKLATGGESDDDEYHENRLILWIEKRFPATKEWNGTRLTVIENGKRLITPLLVVILALGTTDLLFALDSIPAIYGLTKEPFLVLTANIFALMGLRQLYFLIGGPAQEARLPQHRSRRAARLHRRQARHARPPREQPAVHQRRPAHRGRAGHPDPRVAGGHRAHPRCHDGRAASGSRLATPDSNRRTPPAEGCGRAPGRPRRQRRTTLREAAPRELEVSGSGPTSRPPATGGWRAVGAGWR